MNRSYLSIILAFSLLYFSCKKEDAFVRNPGCNIVSPEYSDQISQGNTVVVSAEASGGGMISEVLFYIDGVERGSDTSIPFTYEWNTSNENLGLVSIKCTCFFEGGGNASSEIVVSVVNETIIDPRDNKSYEVVIIGSQTWLAENLSYVTPNSSFYNSDPLIGEEYGRLYNWEEAQTACPVGWHLPSDEEWKVLEESVGMQSDQLDLLDWRGSNEGGKIKCDYGWSSSDTSTNSTGFSALPGGWYSVTIGAFTGGGNDGAWWASTQSETSDAYYRWLTANNYQINRNTASKQEKFSVRCVKE